MKKKIINGLVILVMAIIANYPIYKDLQQSAQVAKGLIDDANYSLKIIKNEMAEWQEDLNSVKTRIDNVQHNLQETVNNGLMNIDSALVEIQSIKLETTELNKKVNQALTDYSQKSEEKVKEKVNKIIPGLPGFE